MPQKISDQISVFFIPSAFQLVFLNHVLWTIHFLSLKVIVAVIYKAEMGNILLHYESLTQV